MFVFLSLSLPFSLTLNYFPACNYGKFPRWISLWPDKSLMQNKFAQNNKNEIKIESENCWANKSLRRCQLNRKKLMHTHTHLYTHLYTRQPIFIALLLLLYLKLFDMCLLVCSTPKLLISSSKFAALVLLLFCCCCCCCCFSNKILSIERLKYLWNYDNLFREYFECPQTISCCLQRCLRYEA